MQHFMFQLHVNDINDPVVLAQRLRAVASHLDTLKGPVESGVLGVELDGGYAKI